MQKTLEGWEKYLRSYLGHIRLLAEIPIDFPDIENIQSLIRDLMYKVGFQSATNKLVNDTPTVFITYLAAFSAMNTEFGFWEALFESLGKKQDYDQNLWGNKFISICRKNNLKEFGFSGPWKFVKSIRIHGGIPVYSLPDFFEYMLLPSLEKIYWRDLSSEEFIQRTISGDFIFYGDHSVLNFFEFSDSIGVDYLDACKQMVRDLKEKGFFESSNELSLPAYVVETYEEYLQSKLEEKPGESAPRILFDFNERTITLIIPELFLSPSLVDNDLFWRVLIPSSGIKEEIPIRHKRVGMNVKTIEDKFQLKEPAQLITLSLISKSERNQEEKVHRIWKIPVFPDADRLPVVVWQNIEDQPTLLRWRQKIPAEMLAVMLPAECNIYVDGEEKRLGEFGQLQNAFSGWKLEVWDFSNANYILIERDNDFPWPAIPISAKPPEIKFVNCEPYFRDQDPDGSSLFINEVPSLQFPIRRNSTNLEKWKIALSSEGIEHSLDAVINLGEVSGQLDFSEDLCILDLSNFFKESPGIGTYKVEINGPFGFNQVLRFRLWPNLRILGFPNSIEIKTEDKIDFTIASTLDFECESQTDEENISIEKTVGLYRVSIPSSAERIDLYLTTRTKAGIPIRVPIYIAIPGAKWMMGGISTITQMVEEWHHHEYSIALDLLLQAQQPSLHLRVYGQEVDCGKSRLILCDPTQPESEIQVIYPNRNIMGAQAMYFDLAGIKNNLEYFKEISIFQLKAEISCNHIKDPEVLSVVAIKRELQITDVDLTELSRDELRYQLTWTEEYSLRNRRSLIWSVWQPWADPIELRIPDNSKGKIEFSGISLPPSHYRIAFYTAYPWEEKRKDIPLDGFHDVAKVDPQEKIKEVTRMLEHGEEDQFLLHFTLACVCHSINDEENFQHEITWCRQHLGSATISKAISFYEWLGVTDPLTQKATAMKMRQPEMLESLFNSMKKEDSIRKRYIQILTTIKIDLQNLEIARLLLNNSNDPLLEFRGFNSLILHEDQEIVGIILDWIDKGRLSIGNAVEILAKNPNFALNKLESYKEHNPIANVLIKKILDQCGDLDVYIKKGYLIETEAGTGTIVELLGKNKEELDYMRQGINLGVLVVALHDEISSEIVDIDLEKKTIHFINAERLFICTKCNQFVSAYQEKVVNEHNKIAHGGIGPAFRSKQSSIIDFENNPIIRCNKSS